MHILYNISSVISFSNLKQNVKKNVLQFIEVLISNVLDIFIINLSEDCLFKLHVLSDQQSQNQRHTF